MAGAVTRQTAGGKHQTDHETPDAKRPKTEKQTTLEESFDVKKDEKDGEGEVSGEGKNGTEKTASKDEDEGSQPDGKDQAKEDNGDKEDASEDADAKDKAENSHAKDTAIRPGADDSVPSNILEKGLIYFFVRARVNIDSPSAVDDLARSFMLLRPMPLDARLGKGTVPDASNARLLALPKKVFPASGRDRFMVFVEKSGVSYEELKKEFLDGEDYDTKTAGQRHTPAATPVGEGVYAVTTTGRESHLAYMMTLPEKLGQAQEELGLKEKGSFILSTKNPQHGGPANATLSTPPAYPKESVPPSRMPLLSDLKMQDPR